jgi:carboxyl-terminal processing protease
VKDPIDVSLTRETIKVKATRFRLEGDVGYIRVTSFTEQATSGVLDAVEKIKKEAGTKLKGFVLDLRNNPGRPARPGDLHVRRLPRQGRDRLGQGAQGEDVQRWNAKPATSPAACRSWC